MILLLISFVAGALTVLAPCILPLLPVVIGGSLTGGGVNKKKAFTVVLSLGASVIVFTLLLKVSTIFINIPEDFWKWFSGGVIILLGLVFVFPRLWAGQFIARMSSKANIALGLGAQKKSFWGDVLMGAALGPVFSTCSPTYFIVLATVLPANPALGILYLLSYVLGLSISLFIVAFLGQKVLAKLNIAADPNGRFKKIVGVLFLIVGVFILAGYDKKLQTQILDSGFFDITNVEQKLLQKVDLNKNSEAVSPTKEETGGASLSPSPLNQSPEKTYLTPAQKSLKFVKAPELVTPEGYINTGGKEIKISDYIGKKVILVDFWTYSCINCKRTTPYLNAWYDKYEGDGFVIIGVHTPEFSFEKVRKNVENAVLEEDVKYPVVLDNDFSTWNAFGNHYWPRKYLIDIDGYIVYDKIGEGDYDITEKMIREALVEKNARLGLSTDMPAELSLPRGVVAVEGAVRSPEIYFGSARNEQFANGTKYKNGSQELILPETFKSNNLYLAGDWNFTGEYAEGQTGADIVFKYEAKNVYMVASSDIGAQVEIFLDGTLIKTIDIRDEKLYDIINGNDYKERPLKLRVKSGTLKAFTFTFG